MNLLDCFSYLKCCCDGKPIIEVDDVECCNNCCRDGNKHFKAFKTRTWAYFKRYSTF